jgi:hypothetical protein
MGTMGMSARAARGAWFTLPTLSRDTRNGLSPMRHGPRKRTHGTRRRAYRPFVSLIAETKAGTTCWTSPMIA